MNWPIQYKYNILNRVKNIKLVSKFPTDYSASPSVTTFFDKTFYHLNMHSSNNRGSQFEAYYKTSTLIGETSTTGRCSGCSDSAQMAYKNRADGCFLLCAPIWRDPTGYGQYGHLPVSYYEILNHFSQKHFVNKIIFWLIYVIFFLNFSATFFLSLKKLKSFLARINLPDCSGLQFQTPFLQVMVNRKQRTSSKQLHQMKIYVKPPSPTPNKKIPNDIYVARVKPHVR